MPPIMTAKPPKDEIMIKIVPIALAMFKITWSLIRIANLSIIKLYVPGGLVLQRLLRENQL